MEDVPSLPRLFLDSNVFIAALVSNHGASYTVMVMAAAGLFVIVTSRYVLAEVERNMRQKFPSLFPAYLGFMERLSYEEGEPRLEEIEKWETIIERKDAPVLAAAVKAQPQRLITLDERHFTSGVAERSGLYICTPGEFIRELRVVIAGGIS